MFLPGKNFGFCSFPPKNYLRLKNAAKQQTSHMYNMFVLFCFSITLQCPYCRNEYDMHAIEQLLITNVQEKSMASVLQDVMCSKCNGVSAEA